jgi:hypothetical protein
MFCHRMPSLVRMMMKFFSVFFLVATSAWSCTISIAAPANNAVVSGPTTLSASTLACPSTVRFEWRINGQPLMGAGTFENSYSIPTCTGGTCTSSYTQPGFGIPYNASYNWDGVYPLTALAMDASGAVLATSPAVNVTVNKQGFGACSLTSPNFANPQSGTINITVHCPLSGVPSNTPYSDAEYFFMVDGQVMASFFKTGYPDQTLSFDTTKLENGSSHLVWVAVNSSNNQTPGTFGMTPFAGAFGVMTTVNTNHSRELRMNYKTSYLWLGGTSTVSLFARTTNDDNSESATNATFTTDTLSVAKVGSCTLVASCTITGIGPGLAMITATTASGLSAKTQISVQTGTPIFPHLGYDGSKCIAYNQGNCAPNKSQIGRSLFDANSSTMTNANLRASMLNAGYNLPQISIYPSPADHSYPSFASWKSFYWNGQYLPGINTVLGSFRSFVAQCNSMGATGQQLQSSSDGNGAASDGAGFAARVAYMLGTIPAKINFCLNGDENALPFIRSYGSGQMGAVNGPTSLVVSGGTITINWPNVIGFFPIDITGATSFCLNATKISVSGRVPGPFTIPNTHSCANGTYNSSTDPSLVIKIYNEMDACAGVNGCQNFGPLNIPVPNSIFQTITHTLLAATPPIQMDLPLQGGAPKLAYQIATTFTGINGIYWTWDGPENSAESKALPNGRLVRSTLLSMETHFWAQAWAGIDHSEPFYLLTQGNGVWYERGGQTYTLGTTNGAQFTTSVPNNAAVGARINVTEAACTGQFMDVASIQSSTTFTVSQSPACSGSGGTVIISSTNRFFTPPMDRIKFPGLRGVEIAAQQWEALSLGAMGERLFNYFPSLPNQFNDYPASAHQTYVGIGVNGQSFENNNTALNEDFTKDPSAQERWYASGVTQRLIAGLEPQLIQPSCNAPDFGPRVHTGAKCGALGTLVILINDNETPLTLYFPSSLWGLYNSGGAAITLFQEIKAAYVNTTNFVAASTSGSWVMDGGEVDLLWFPSGLVPLTQNTTLTFNPGGGGGTQTALRLSPLCNPETHVSNLDQQPSRIVFGSSITLALDPAIGPICYDYLYLDGSNVPVAPVSAVQVLRFGSAAISGQVTITGGV